MPRRDSSIETLASDSFDRWKPGTTTTSGAGLSLVALFGLNRSATTHWPFWVGILMSCTCTRPPDVWTTAAATHARTTMTARERNSLVPAVPSATSD